MSYTIDVYRGHAAPLRSFVDFACYVSMFPQLVAGPIIRFAEVADQLRERTCTVTKFARGVAFLSVGLTKKILLANPCGQVADLAFDAGSLGALDAFTRENMQELILQVWSKSKKVVFFITHSVEEALFMATRLIVMSPRPGRITHEYRLDFCQRYFEQGNARKIKSDPDFIKVREEILSIIYGEKIEE